MEIAIPISQSDDLLLGQYKLTFDASTMSGTDFVLLFNRCLTLTGTSIPWQGKSFTVDKVLIDGAKNDKIAFYITVTKNPFPIVAVVACILAALAAWLVLDKVEKIVEVTPEVLGLGLAVVVVIFILIVKKQ